MERITKFNIKPLFLALILLTTVFPAICDESEYPPIKFNPWELIIYRPENTEEMNYTRCYLKLEDAETGEDVTYTAIKAWYEWVSETKVTWHDPQYFVNLFKSQRKITPHPYEKSYYLSGGMAMHMNIKSGKYKITVYTPVEWQMNLPCSGKETWTSNEFYYDTSNPAKVIFVCPVANDNGFYTGEWYIDYKAPQFYIYTKPKMN